MAKSLKTKIDVPEGEDKELHAGDAGEPRVTKDQSGGSDPLARNAPEGGGGHPASTGSAHPGREKGKGKSPDSKDGVIEPKKRRGNPGPEQSGPKSGR